MSDGAGVPTGTPLSDPAVVEMISEDPVLRNTKLIAEAWDADGLNQACRGVTLWLSSTLHASLLWYTAVLSLSSYNPPIGMAVRFFLLTSTFDAVLMLDIGTFCPFSGGCLSALWRPLGRVEWAFQRHSEELHQSELGALWLVYVVESRFLSFGTQ